MNIAACDAKVNVPGAIALCNGPMARKLGHRSDANVSNRQESSVISSTEAG
jgi:hypothetical protein